MDSLGALHAFVQAVEAGGFTEAGRRLGTSASAISKAVARLEDQLGVRLFHRSTRSITLTQEGAIFLERARRILCEFEAAQLEVTQSQAVPRGSTSTWSLSRRRYSRLTSVILPCGLIVTSGSRLASSKLRA